MAYVSDKYALGICDRTGFQYKLRDLVYQYKRKKLKNIKILRKIITNFFLFFFNILKFQLKTSIINLAEFCGVIKFLIYLMKSLYR